MIENYKLFFANAFDFSGRSTRKEYWSAWLVTFLINMVLATLAGSNQGGLFTAIYTIFGLVYFIPLISIGVRRLHDVGQSGLWLLLIITVIGAFVILYWLCKDSQEGTNQYGEDPRILI